MQGKIKSIEQIYLFSMPVKEYQIVESFLGSALKDEVMKIMPVQKQTRAGQRTRFKVQTKWHARSRPHNMHIIWPDTELHLLRPACTTHEHSLSQTVWPAGLISMVQGSKHLQNLRESVQCGLLQTTALRSEYSERSASGKGLQWAW